MSSCLKLLVANRVATVLACLRSTTWTPPGSSEKRANTSESSQPSPWSARCTLTQHRRICIAPTNPRPSAQYPGRSPVYYRPRSHAGPLATTTMFISRRHDSRCRRYRRRWEPSKRSLTLDLSHLRRLPQHQVLNTTHRCLRLHHPQIHARGRSSQTPIVFKVPPTRSRTLAVLTSSRLPLKCRPHHRLRKYGHRMSHAPTRHSSTTHGYRHCTLSRPPNPHRLLSLD